MKTIKEMAKDALRVQDACNLRGVLGSFHEASLALGRLPECQGTDWVNTHPIMVLYSDKVAELTGGGSARFVREAFDACRELAGE